MAVSEVKIWDLPDEVIHKIFSYMTVKEILTTAVDVCDRWRAIIDLDMLFWKNLQLVVHCDRFLNLSYLDPSFANSLDVLKKSQGRNDSFYIGEKDLKKVSKVRLIKLEEGNESISHPALLLIRILDKISKTCKNIEYIEYFHCFGATSSHFIKFLNERLSNISEIKFGITAVWRIPYEEFVNFRNLDTLISHDYRFTRLDLCKITDGCQKLTRLWILFSRSIKNDDVIYFLEKRKDTLMELGIGLSVSDSVLQKLQECCNLNVIFITDARYISETGLNYLTNLYNLKYISLHRAKFHPNVISKWILLPTVPAKLSMLDLTDYYYKDSICTCEKFPITFSNDLNKAVAQSYKPKSHIHWMYYNVLQ